MLLAFGLVAVPSAFAADAPDKLADPRLEARAVALQRDLRCVVCQGESLDESNAPLAADLRGLIRSKIEAGWSDAAIERFLVARYGDFILMKPPFEPLTYGLWFGPALVLLIGGGIAATAIFHARNQAKSDRFG